MGGGGGHHLASHILGAVPEGRTTAGRLGRRKGRFPGRLDTQPPPVGWELPPFLSGMSEVGAYPTEPSGRFGALGSEV